MADGYRLEADAHRRPLIGDRFAAFECWAASAVSVGLAHSPKKYKRKWRDAVSVPASHVDPLSRA